MKLKIYFCGSIRGGREDAALYQQLIRFIQKTDTVLTEHIGDINYTSVPRSVEEERSIYSQDTSWLRECDLVIAECSQPSLGVGYELAFAEKLGKPTYVLHRKDSVLSAMIGGNPYFHCFAYDAEEGVLAIISDILTSNRPENCLN